MQTATAARLRARWVARHRALGCRAAALVRLGAGSAVWIEDEESILAEVLDGGEIIEATCESCRLLWPGSAPAPLRIVRYEIPSRPDSHVGA